MNDKWVIDYSRIHVLDFGIDCLVATQKSLLLTFTNLGSQLPSRALKLVIYVVLDVTKKMTVSKRRK